MGISTLLTGSSATIVGVSVGAGAGAGVGAGAGLGSSTVLSNAAPNAAADLADAGAFLTAGSITESKRDTVLTFVVSSGLTAGLPVSLSSRFCFS